MLKNLRFVSTCFLKVPLPFTLSSLTEINLFSFSEDLPFCARLVQVFLVLAQKAKSKENRFIFFPSLEVLKADNARLVHSPANQSQR